MRPPYFIEVNYDGETWNAWAYDVYEDRDRLVIYTDENASNRTVFRLGAVQHYSIVELDQEDESDSADA